MQRFRIALGAIDVLASSNTVPSTVGKQATAKYGQESMMEPQYSLFRTTLGRVMLISVVPCCQPPSQPHQFRHSWPDSPYSSLASRSRTSNPWPHQQSRSL